MLGRTGSGKTYLAMKVCEEMLKINSQVIALDPVGKWYGLQTLKNGKKGFSIPVFGGLHGDIPLQSTSGTLIADLIVDKHISAVLDISQFETDREKARFSTDFSARLFFRKKAAPSPIHLFIEECQEFIPQNIMKGEEQMLHNFQRIWKLGRNFGIGGSLISQRPQEINKKALNQTECVFTFQMTGPQEKKAIEEWVGAKGFEEKENIKDLLPKLKNGECWIWSPVWLNTVQLIKVDEKETIDISATPKLGEKKIVPAKLSLSEIEDIKIAMNETIEQTKENDPSELKKKIFELEKKIRKEISPTPPINKLTEKHLQELIVEKEKIIKNYQDKFKHISLYIDKIRSNDEVIEKILAQCTIQYKPEVELKSFSNPEIDNSERGKTFYAENKNNSISKCERSILLALAQRGKASIKSQIGILSGYYITSGSFNNSLSKLRTQGFININGTISITNEGLSILGNFEPLPEREELQRYWLSQLGKCEGAILKVLLLNFPNEISKEQISEQCNYAVSSGSFNNSLSKLRTLELIEGRKEIKAAQTFFE